MNLPNRITVARLFFAPLFFVVYMLPEYGLLDQVVSMWVLILLFALIELSDLLDGIIARKWGLVTDVGKVLDPFSDVISRITYFICLAYSGLMPLAVLLVIVYRELSVTFLRMLLMKQQVAMAASVWGKSKAVLYAVTAILGIALLALMRLAPEYELTGLFQTIYQYVCILAALAAVFSFLDYFLKARGKLSSLSR